jgi:dipeptidyl-peptidase-4
MIPTSVRRAAPLCAALAFLVAAAAPAAAQDRLKAHPRYERYRDLGRKIPSTYKPGAVAVKWHDDGAAAEWRADGKVKRFELATKTAKDLDKATPEAKQPPKPAPRTGKNLGQPERGRQFSGALSPDGTKKATYKDRNLFLSDADGGAEIAVTTEGDEKKRTKFGCGSWVYGEELDQNTAMWWSPDSSMIAYYGFDETGVTDFYLQLDQTKFISTADVEAYPKVGGRNPVAEVFVYDLAAKKSVKVDVRDGKPFEDEVVGHYVYNVRWTQAGDELLFHRTNRWQNVMELCAADPKTGKVRVVLREEWLPSWTENNPFMRWLEDGKRFIWASQRNGFNNLYLYDLSGKLLATLTNHKFEVGGVERLFEDKGELFYTARSGDNYMKMQLHRVSLTGEGDKRLTDPALHHDVDVAPNGAWFVDVAQTHDVPATTRLVDRDGNVLAEIGKSDLTEFDKLGLKRVEMFTFKAGDGTTDLHGMLHFPSDFDPAKKYPVLLSIYCGPATNGCRESFTLPSGLTELGFLYLTLDARSAAGRGKEFLDAIYRKLGTTEIDDLAAGVKEIAKRPYVDGKRVGVFGTSYGGYASALCVLRYPDVFAAASAMSAVTDWRQYDTIYTERYMRTYETNKAGYDAGSCMAYAKNLQGRLMIYYGTADNNVHPNNAMQLIAALQRAGKVFEVQAGPDQGHTALANPRMLEFFVQALCMKEAFLEGL